LEEDMLIKYTIQASPLGRLLIASTEKGICMVSLGDSDPNLVEALRERFSAAEFERNNAYFDKMMPAFLSYLTGQRPELDLPVDIGTTPFRLKVYEALKKIPYGKTCSYEEVAQAIGNPRAIRAVGSACANNPVALVIPCHRVVRKDGSLGGYRWGLKRKEKLLEMERRLTPM
jgi:AraC family transcriptional regulator of adaptative response/methylated-DNA-[protein]-cysteine methyltransferase